MHVCVCVSECVFVLCSCEVLCMCLFLCRRICVVCVCVCECVSLMCTYACVHMSVCVCACVCASILVCTARVSVCVHVCLSVTVDWQILYQLGSLHIDCRFPSQKAAADRVTNCTRLQPWRTARWVRVV